MSDKLQVKWSGDLTFVGTNSTGHSVVMDGNKKIGISPMEMLLLGTGGCMSVDMVMILKKARQKVVEVLVEVQGDRREEMPKYFETVTLHFIIKGTAVKEQHVERAIDLALEKYCSASAQMAALATIKTSFEVVEAELPA